MHLQLPAGAELGNIKYIWEVGKFKMCMDLQKANMEKVKILKLEKTGNLKFEEIREIKIKGDKRDNILLLGI